MPRDREVLNDFLRWCGVADEPEPELPAPKERRGRTEVRNPDAVIPGRMPFKRPVGTRPISKEVKTFKHTDK